MAAEVAEKIPLFGDILGTTTVDDLEVSRLAGLTNRNFLLVAPVGKFVLRLAGDGTSSYINRHAEKHNASAAMAVGANARVEYFDANDGTMLCRYLEGAITMSGARFANDHEAVRRAGKVLSLLHLKCAPFQGRFELFAQIDEYRRTLVEREALLPEGFEEAEVSARAAREALGQHPLPSVPSHCDPLAENFLDDGSTMFLIDYEYAGMNDPMWDLGDLSVEAGFNEEQDEALLEAYFEGSAGAYDRGRMVMYKALCDLCWSLWGMIQHADGNPAEDFFEYSNNRLLRCRTLMASTAFAAHLAAVSAGPAQ